jgi:hypothetical protein
MGFGESEANYKTLIHGGDESAIKNEANKTVFETDAKLGSSYTKALNDDFAFAIEAGYRGAYYFDALQKEKTQLPVSDVLTNVNNDNNDYYNYGPYVSVVVNFM